jgi:Rieske Fe-S protein
VVAAVGPILIFIYPPSAGNKRTDLKIALDTPLNKLANGQAVKFQAPKDSGFVMKTGGGDNAPGKVAFAGYVVKEVDGAINVFAINCSHLGCSVNLNQDAKRFECPCHGSMFALTGDVIHGPAVYPLSLLDWKQGPTPGVILVSGLNLPGIG